QRAIGEVKRIIVRLQRALDIAAPSGVLASCQVTAIDAVLESLLPELLPPRYARVGVPTISLSFADAWTFIPIDIGRREPGRAAAFVHVDAVVIIGEFKWIAILTRIDPYPRRILLHRVAHTRERHIDAFEEPRVVSWPVAVVLIDQHRFFGDLSLRNKLRIYHHSNLRRNSFGGAADRNAYVKWDCPGDAVTFT